MKLEAWFKSRCESIAVEQRRQLGLRAYDPLPAEHLITKLEGQALPPDKVPNMPSASVDVLLENKDWSAGIIRRNPLLIVYHPDHFHVSARHQSNLMHELAHVLLNHPMIGFDPVTGLPLRDSHYEEEATYLGGCLQIPRLGLQWASQRGYTWKQIALYFGASEGMVRFRCNMTGINIKDVNVQDHP